MRLEFDLRAEYKQYTGNLLQTEIDSSLIWTKVRPHVSAELGTDVHCIILPGDGRYYLLSALRSFCAQHGTDMSFLRNPAAHMIEVTKNRKVFAAKTYGERTFSKWEL